MGKTGCIGGRCVPPRPSNAGGRARQRHLRRGDGQHRRRAAGRDRGSREPGAHRAVPGGVHRRLGGLPVHGSQAGDLLDNLQPAGLLDGAARGHRIDVAVHGERGRAALGRCPGGDDNGERGVAARRRAARAAAAGADEGSGRRAADEQELGEHGGADRRCEGPGTGRRRGADGVSPAGVGARRQRARRDAHDGRPGDGQLLVRLLVHDAAGRRRGDGGADLRDRGRVGGRAGRRRPREHHPEGGRQPLQRFGVRQLGKQLAAG